MNTTKPYVMNVLAKSKLLWLVLLSARLTESALASAADSNAVSQAICAGNETVFNVRAFGAVGDGKHVDSRAINQAIRSCAENGGGTVYFPAGTYLSSWTAP